MWREGEALVPMGDMLRDTLRCSFRYCLRLLPTPAFEKLPSRCVPDGALDWEPSSWEALMLRRRLSLRFRAMCTSWLGSTVGRGGGGVLGMLLPCPAGWASSMLVLILGTRSRLLSCAGAASWVCGELSGEVLLLLHRPDCSSSAAARLCRALVLPFASGVCGWRALCRVRGPLGKLESSKKPPPDLPVRCRRWAKSCSSMASAPSGLLPEPCDVALWPPLAASLLCREPVLGACDEPPSPLSA